MSKSIKSTTWPAQLTDPLSVGSCANDQDERVGSSQLLGLAKRLKIPVLQASTSEVYGDPSVHPQPESYWGNVNPIGPRAVYDEAKRAAEAFTMAYHRTHAVRIKI